MRSQAYINNQHIRYQNNTSQLYFILERANLCWYFTSLLRNDSDIHKFPSIHMVKIYFLLENLWISQSSLGIQEKIQCTLPLVYIIVQCYLYVKQFGWYASKYILSKTTIVKPSQNFLISKIWNLLKFLQDAERESVPSRTKPSENNHRQTQVKSEYMC